MSKILPSYVQNKSKDIQSKWSDIYSKYDTESMSLSMANNWLQSYREEVVVRDFTFNSDTEQIVFRSSDGTEYVDFLLADNKADSYGTNYTNSYLKEMADMVNSGKVTLNGDFNHDLVHKLQEDGYTKEAIKNKVTNFKSGVAKAIKAIYENGKLYIRAKINSRYKKRIMSSKGVSIEGSFIRKGNTFVGGTILGFSFIDAENKQLGNKRAKILR